MAIHIRRREFIATLGGVAAAWPRAARAQQPAMPVVGFFHFGSSKSLGHLAVAVRRGLADTDFFEGRNVAIEYQWGDNAQPDRLLALAADLVRRQPTVIIAARQPALALKDTATTIPIVFSTADDPIKLGFVASLNRPGGNMTGVYLFTAGLEGKRLGLLRDMVPKTTTMGVLVDSRYPGADDQLIEVQQAAARLGTHLIRVSANSERELESVFARLVEHQATALLVCSSSFFNDRRDRLIALAERHKIPAGYERREFVTAGGLMSYGDSLVESYRQLGQYAGRILKGEKPADLPVVRPTKFELVINRKTAKALGVNISDNFLTLADEVIE
jgi:ABC-type uncharacterized transport system substrate-binding protein